jgi:quinol monooxygenase YgiN
MRQNSDTDNGSECVNHGSAPFTIRRRDFLAVLAQAAPALALFGLAETVKAEKGTGMFGQISKIAAIPGKRDELIAILLEGSTGMPGCLTYIVAQDANEADSVWIAEAWKSKQDHQASLASASVKQAMSKGRPLIAGFGTHATIAPVGGVGLPTD